jgi:hypothetical protein
MNYRLNQGVYDFGNTPMMNQFESGYSFLFVLEGPRFIERLADISEEIRVLYTNFLKILTYEFRGLSGLDDLTTDMLEITNGISQMGFIGKVNKQTNASISMRFFEKSGGTITKFANTYITGIKDPYSQLKRYHGLIDDGFDDGLENEIFKLFYLVTDNTGMRLENAFLLLNAQITDAKFSDLYNSEKGQIENKELDLQWVCFPVTGNPVTLAGKKILDYMNSTQNPNKLIANHNDFVFTGVEKDLDGNAITPSKTALTRFKGV